MPVDRIIAERQRKMIEDRKTVLGILKFAITLTVFILAAQMMVGCSSNTIIHEHPTEIRKYSLQFDTIYRVNSSEVSITFEPSNRFGPNVLALAYTDHIIVNSKKWKKLKSNQRLYVIFHELGHILFDRGHKNTLFPDRCPRSFMYKYTGTERRLKFCFKKHLDKMFLELDSIIGDRQ